MIRNQNVCGNAILMCLIPILVGVILSALRSPLAPINEGKEVLIHIRFSIVHPVTKNVIKMATSADADEAPRFRSTLYVNAPFV